MTHEATWTPDWLAARMAARIDLCRLDTVLEPSAGRGALVRAALACGSEVYAVELNEENCAFLRQETAAAVLHADFLRMNPDVPLPLAHPKNPHRFQAVIMNPPFNALPHVEHAVKFLEPEGRLVALLHRNVAVEAARKLGGSVEALPDNLFQIEGRAIQAALYVR